MRYMQQLEEKLRELLAQGDESAVISFVKETVLESYRNGQKLSKPKEPRRSPQPRK